MAAAPAFVLGVHMPRFKSRGAFDRSQCSRSAVPVPEPPGNLTVFIVDGLGFEYAMLLPELGWLRAEAAIRPLRAGFPSYTTPAILAFVTGVGPAASGVRLNTAVDGLTAGLDNIRASAESAGRAIDFFDGGWEPFAAIVFADEAVLRRGRISMRLAPFLPREPRSLRWVYFGDVDAAGHQAGAASTGYQRAAVTASRLVRRHWAELGPDDRLIVLSDHGHLPTGGHGGMEPAVRAATFAILGRDVKRGEVLGPRPIDDVASTVASLSGIPTPGCNLGRPMLDMLALVPAATDALAANAIDQRTRLEARIDLPRGDDRAIRLVVALLLTGALGVAMRRHRPSAAAWGAPAGLAVGYVGFLVLSGYRLTFSKMPQRWDFITDAILAGLIGSVLALAYVWRRDVDRAGEALLVGTSLPMLWMAAWSGYDPRIVPPPYVGVAVILWAPTMVAAGVTVIVLTAVSAVRRRGETPHDPA